MDPFQKPHFYFIELQFLGFRYHGWAKQLEVKTVQGMVNKTLKYILSDIPFKTLGAGRTDAMVSANGFVFELFTKNEIDIENFIVEFNVNLPQDIKALDISQTDEVFNIIQSAKLKEYVYLFSFGSKNHPFSAPFITSIQQQLDVKLMIQGAKLFEGTYNFIEYCYKPGDKTNFNRTIEYCEIQKNDLYTANFFPKESYLLRVKGKGFMYHQIRLMMGALIRLGKNEINTIDIEKSLEGINTFEQNVAPASGLILNAVKF